MRGLRVLIVAIAIVLAGCTGGGHHRPPTVAANRDAAAAPARAAMPSGSTSAAGTPAPDQFLVPGMQDVGQFVISASGPVQAENRAATTLLHLQPGDEIQLPAGMTWPPLPNSVAGLHWLNFTAHISGHTLSISGTTASGHALSSGEQIDARTFRVLAAADVLFWANQEDVLGENGSLADCPIAIDAAGHLWLAPLPVPPNTVVDEGSGVGLDVRGMKRVGWLPSDAHPAGQAGGFFFTSCNFTRQRCNFVDRLAAPLTAPFSGALMCRDGTNFDLAADGFVLEFVDVAQQTRPRPATPVSGCGPGVAVNAGQEIDDTAAHYLVFAESNTGEPLSAVVSYDGTIYVGPLTVPPLDGPGRLD